MKLAIVLLTFRCSLSRRSKPPIIAVNGGSPTVRGQRVRPLGPHGEQFNRYFGCGQLLSAWLEECGASMYGIVGQEAPAVAPET